ncbi:MAG: DUF2269 family protein [Rhizobiales bacterium]|nr:DUF2269 family protein [Hyphomicrobiales bacterium]
MLSYDILLFLHISAAVIWLGSGFLLHILACRAERAGGAPARMAARRDRGTLGNVLFVPASLATLVFGIALVLVGGWAFTDLWIVLALIGYATSFIIGAFVLKPRGEAIGATVARDGISAEVIRKGRQLSVIGRVEATVLFVIVALMALKPSVDDVATLAGIAVLLVAGVALSVVSGRAPSPEAATA